MQSTDFNIFAKIITDMVKKMLFLWVCESGQELIASDQMYHSYHFEMYRL